MNKNIEKRVFDIMTDILEVEPNYIEPDKTFDELEIDSILFIRLVVQCETELNIQFEDEMLLTTRFPDVNTFVTYVMSRCGTKDGNE